MTAGCARCGNCCENIWLATGTELLRWTSACLQGVPDPSSDDGWAYWQQNGWADGNR